MEELVSLIGAGKHLEGNTMLLLIMLGIFFMFMKKLFSLISASNKLHLDSLTTVYEKDKKLTDDKFILIETIQEFKNTFIKELRIIEKELLLIRTDNKDDHSYIKDKVDEIDSKINILINVVNTLNDSLRNSSR